MKEGIVVWIEGITFYLLFFTFSFKIKPCHCLSTSINKASETHYLSFKVITPVSDILVLLCFHPDTVRQLTPL